MWELELCDIKYAYTWMVIKDVTHMKIGSVK